MVISRVNFVEKPTNTDNNCQTFAYTEIYTHFLTVQSEPAFKHNWNKVQAQLSFFFLEHYILNQPFRLISPTILVTVMTIMALLRRVKELEGGALEDEAAEAAPCWLPNNAVLESQSTGLQ